MTAEVASGPSDRPEATALTSPRPAPPAGVYVHVPFCVSLCPYCDFVVYSGSAARGPRSRVAAFVAALHVELDLRADVLDARFGRPGPGRPPLTSCYLGGGTPSLLSADVVAGLLAHVHERFGLADGAEVTLEANPGADEIGDLVGFRAAGVTRLSIGAQSLDRDELRALGRRHRPADVASAVAAARAAGFVDVGLDLLTDVPGQTDASWRATLRAALELGIDHLSIYQLQLGDPDAEGLTGRSGDHLPVRPGARRWRDRTLPQQDDERARRLDVITDELTADADFERYEISNLARPGHRSRHNRLYWRRGSFVGLGPGAHSSDGALVRSWNAARLDRYLAALDTGPGHAAVLPPGGRDVVDAPTARAEAAMLALRTAEGVDAGLADDAGLAAGLAWALEHGLVGRHGDRLVLTEEGRALADEVALRLLPARPVGARSAQPA